MTAPRPGPAPDRAAADEIDERDLKIRVLRTGPDGIDWQFSAGPHDQIVRVEHLPSGIVMDSSSERNLTQIQKRDQCIEAIKWQLERNELTAELDRQRALLRAAETALRRVGKAALVVKPTLDKPYSDAPSITPWERYMRQPAADAYNLGCRIRALLEGEER